MASLNAPSNPENQNTTVAKPVPITTSFDAVVFARLLKYTSKQGLGKEQNVIRLAVSKFLDKEGY
jgi:hypothetical protein